MKENPHWIVTGCPQRSSHTAPCLYKAAALPHNTTLPSSATLPTGINSSRPSLLLHRLGFPPSARSWVFLGDLGPNRMWCFWQDYGHNAECMLNRQFINLLPSVPHLYRWPRGYRLWCTEGSQKEVANSAFRRRRPVLKDSVSVWETETDGVAAVRR